MRRDYFPKRREVKPAMVQVKKKKKNEKQKELTHFLGNEELTNF